MSGSMKRVTRIPDQAAYGRMKADSEQLWKHVSDLERTDGAQFARALEKIKSLIAGLDAQVAAAIAANSYTKSQIDVLVNAVVAAARIVGVLAPGQGGTGTANVHETTGTGVQQQVYVQPDGLLTRGASSERYKTDIAGAMFDLGAVLGMEPREFRWRSDTAVESADRAEQLALASLADDGGPPGPDIEVRPAPLDYGLIAEEAHAAGLFWLVRYDDEGRPDGIRYERLPVALLAVVRELDARIGSLEMQAHGFAALMAAAQAEIQSMAADMADMRAEIEALKRGKVE